MIPVKQIIEYWFVTRFMPVALCVLLLLAASAFGLSRVVADHDEPTLGERQVRALETIANESGEMNDHLRDIARQLESR